MSSAIQRSRDVIQRASEHAKEQNEFSRSFQPEKGIDIDVRVPEVNTGKMLITISADDKTEFRQRVRKMKTELEEIAEDADSEVNLFEANVQYPRYVRENEHMTQLHAVFNYNELDKDVPASREWK